MFVLEETRSLCVCVGGEGSVVKGSCVLFEPYMFVSVCLPITCSAAITHINQ